jgi:hypothetical protein
MTSWNGRSLDRARASGPPGAVHVGATAGVVWGAALATQYVAARLAYHPHLGPWVYRASVATRDRLRLVAIACCLAGVLALATRRWRWGAIPLGLASITATIVRRAPLYSPERVFVWYAAYHALPAYRQLFAGAWLICGTVALLVTLVVLRLRAGGRPPQRADPVRRVSPTMPRLPQPIPRRALGQSAWQQDAVGVGAFEDLAALGEQPDASLVVEASPSPAPL